MQSGLAYARLGRKAARKVLWRCIESAEANLSQHERKRNSQSAGEASSSNRGNAKQFRELLGLAYRAYADLCLDAAFKAKRDAHDTLYEQCATCMKKYVALAASRSSIRSRKARMLQSAGDASCADGM